MLAITTHYYKQYCHPRLPGPPEIAMQFLGWIERGHPHDIKVTDAGSNYSN